MKQAEVPDSESARLRELEGLQILDTESELEFQDLTEIAAYICQKPIALVSLVDASRQWFKARHGLNATETPREFAFCAHAILQEQVFEVSDARNDERFFDNPLVTGFPEVVHYAGAPIYGPSRHPLGTLCVINNTPGKLTDTQRDYLLKLSRQVTKLLEFRHKAKITAEQNENLRYYETALKNLREGVVLQDASGAIRSFNRAALKTLRLSEQELLGVTSIDPMWRCIRSDGSPFPGMEHPAMQSLKTGQSFQEVEMGIVTKDKETAWISINSEPIFGELNGQPTHVVTSFADISEKKRNQEIIVQSAKLSSLGEMAAGIAHEINTPLAVISTSTELLLEKFERTTPENQKIIKLLQRIENTTQRIGSIVRGLRTFARDASKDPISEIRVADVLSDSVSFCRERFKVHGVSLLFDCKPELSALAVSTRLIQVIVNLLGNAFDAVEQLEEKWVRIEARSTKDKRIRISVIDSGKGIPKQFQEKIMTPFFTTKEPGRGTGLGLSISQGLVKDMNGRFWYEIVQGNTAFHIELESAQELHDKDLKIA